MNKTVQQMQFENLIDNVARFMDFRIIETKVLWGYEAERYHDQHDCVELLYGNGRIKVMNTHGNSFQATLMDLTRRLL